MKKLALSLLAICFAFNFSYAQWTTNNTDTYYSYGGNVGIGIPLPSTKLNVQGLGLALNTGAMAVADFFGNAGGGYGRARISLGNANGASGTRSAAFLLYGKNATGSAYESKWEFGSDLGGDGNNSFYFYNALQNKTVFYMDPIGNIGIETTTPISKFQVDGGQSKACIGDASGPDLKYGTSYLGFNAGRNGTNWMINGDNVHNGGGIIYSTIEGEIMFAPIGSTAGTDKILTDANIASTINFKITPTGAFAKKITVQTTAFPDYVFRPTYRLRPLSEVKAYIDQNQHLPEVPAAATVEKEGMDVAEMNKILLKKVEELTLYLIEKDNQLKTQDTKLIRLQGEINSLKKHFTKNHATIYKY